MYEFEPGTLWDFQAVPFQRSASVLGALPLLVL